MLLNIKNSLHSIAHLTRCHMPLPLALPVRNQVQDILKNNRDTNVVLSCLTTLSSVVGLYKSTSIPSISSTDLILLHNML